MRHRFAVQARTAQSPAGAGLWLLLLAAGLFLALTRVEAGAGSQSALVESMSGQPAAVAIEAACPVDCAAERLAVLAGFDGGEEAPALATFVIPSGYPAPVGPGSVAGPRVEVLAAAFSARGPPLFA